MISPSQISTWRLCHRKWGFTYLSGDPRPPATKAQLIGTALHARAEAFINEGKADYSLDAGSSPEVEAVRLLPHILDYLPGTDAFSEQKVSCTIAGVQFGGRFDWLVPVGENDEWELGDLKTTSNLRWAKNELELATDPQVLVYSMAQTATMPDKIQCRWLYVQTKGAPLIREVRVRPDFTALDELVLDGQAITVAWATRPRPEDLEPNTSACDAFGGCPFRSKCVIDPGERLIALQRRMGVPIGGSMSKQQTFEEMMAEANGIAEINPPKTEVPFTDPETLTKSDPPLPAVLDPVKVADPPKAKRTRKIKHAGQDGSAASSDDDRLTGRILFGTEAKPEAPIDNLYISCIPLGELELEYADYIIASARAEINQKAGVEDYRLIPFGAGAGALVAAVEEKIKHIRPSHLALDERTPEGRILSGPLVALSKRVIKGL